MAEAKSTRGRKPNTAVAVQVGPTFVGATPPDMAEQERRVSTTLAEINENAAALADELDYDGALSVGALEDGIRFYQRRSVESCLELGKRLLLLREITPRGEFAARLDALNITDRFSQKMMSATLKFSNAPSTALLAAAGTQTKLLELLVLDDDEIEALTKGKTARGLGLDDIRTMSVREMRAALYEAKANATAKDKLIANTKKRAEELLLQAERIKSLPPDEDLELLRHQLAVFSNTCETEIAGHFASCCRALVEHHTEHGGDSDELILGALRQIEKQLATVRGECGHLGGKAAWDQS